jgi:hypothetical protein
MTTRNEQWLANSGGGEIRRANRDETGRQVLLTGLSRPVIITLDLGVLPPLNTQTATRSHNPFTLTRNALMGRAYQVQFNTDLNQTNWNNLVLRLTSTNTTMSALDSVVSEPQRSYRVLLLP